MVGRIVNELILFPQIGAEISDGIIAILTWLTARSKKVTVVTDADTPAIIENLVSQTLGETRFDFVSVLCSDRSSRHSYTAQHR